MVGRAGRGRVQLLFPGADGARSGTDRPLARRIRGGARRAGALAARLPRPHDGALEVRAAFHAARPRRRTPSRRSSTTRRAARAGRSTAASRPTASSRPVPTCRRSPGDLRTRSFAEIWRASPLFRQLREGTLGGKCGSCEYRAGVRRLPRARVRGHRRCAGRGSVVRYEPRPGATLIEPARAVTYGADFEPVTRRGARRRGSACSEFRPSCAAS